MNDTSPTTRERLLARVRDTLADYVDFYDRISQNATPGWPTFSQAIRMRALERNRRILVADDTGVNGKTFVAVGSKINLDRADGTKHRTLIIAPNSGLLNAWTPEEVNRYASHLRAPEQRVVTITDYADMDHVDHDTDFAIINWEKLSVDIDDQRRKRFDHLLETYDPTFYVLDECHNAKGSSSLRGKTIRSIVDHTAGDYVMLLSATPIPNRYRDLGMIFHLLDPEKYGNPAMFTHCGPDVMKELLDRHVWFRLTRHDLKEELGLPDFKEVEVPVNLSDAEADVYFKAWADCVLLGEGLTELRKTLYNPNLSKYTNGVTFGPSAKAQKTKELADTITRRGEKVLIKSNYVQGVIAPLAAYLGNERVLVVTGDTDPAERRRLYLRWRNDPRHNILLTSPVTEESVDLTTGKIPCSIITLEPEMTPREYTQFTGRVYRRPQEGEVTHYILASQSATLDRMMLDYLKTLSQQHGVKIPKRFRPRTIDRDMLAMRRAKDAIIEKVYGGDHISKQEERVYDADAVDQAVTHLEGLVSPKTFRSMQPFELSALIQSRWRNLGEDQFGELVRSKGWARWKNMYEGGWQGSASESTLHLVGKLVDIIEQELGYTPAIVDVGSGAAYFSRATGKPATCVDIDPKFLKMGEKICTKKGITNSYVPARATETGLPAGKADVVVNAYAIFYLGQDKNRSEVEDCVLETNRLLNGHGHFIVAFPYTLEEPALERFSTNLCAYGFRQKVYLKPEHTKNPHMKKGCYILQYEKTGNVTEKQGKDLSFYEGRMRFIQ